MHIFQKLISLRQIFDLTYVLGITNWFQAVS
jgi:hypothetical protein